MSHSLEGATKESLTLDNFNILVVRLSLELIDADDSAKAGTLVHRVHKVIDFVEPFEVMGHVFGDRELTSKDLVDELRDVLARFPPTEGGTFPAASCDELEWLSLEQLSRSCNSNDGGFTPATARCLESIPHDSYITGAVEGEVDAPLLALLEPLSCVLFHRVMAIGRAKLLGDLKL